MADPRFDDIINRAALRYSVDPDRVRRIIEVESNFDPRAVSGSGAQGLMQLMPDTARELGVTDPFDPEQNIMGGAQYLSKLAKMFPDDIDKQHAAYNFGPGNVSAGRPYPPETVSYVEKLKPPTEAEGGQTYTDEQGRELYIEGNPSPEDIEEIFNQHFASSVPQEPFPVSAGFDQPPDLNRVIKGTIPGQMLESARAVSPPADMSEAVTRGVKGALFDPAVGAIKAIADYPAAAAERSQPYFEKGFSENEPLRFGQGVLASLPFVGEMVNPANKMLTAMGEESAEGSSDVLSNIINLGMVAGGNKAPVEISRNVGSTLKSPIMHDIAGVGTEYAFRRNPYEAGAGIPIRRMLRKMGADPISMLMEAVAKPFDWIGRHRGVLGEGGLIPSGRTGAAMPNKPPVTKPATVNPPEGKVTPARKIGDFTVPRGYRVKSLKEKPVTNEPKGAPATAESTYNVSSPPEVKMPVGEGYIRELTPEETVKSVKEKNLFSRLIEGEKEKLPPAGPLPEGVKAQRLNAEGELEAVAPSLTKMGRPKGSTTRDKGTNLRAVQENPRSVLEQFRKDYDAAASRTDTKEMQRLINVAKKYRETSPNAFKRYFGFTEE